MRGILTAWARLASLRVVLFRSHRPRSVKRHLNWTQVTAVRQRGRSVPTSCSRKSRIGNQLPGATAPASLTGLFSRLCGIRLGHFWDTCDTFSSESSSPHRHRVITHAIPWSQSQADRQRLQGNVSGTRPTSTTTLLLAMKPLLLVENCFAAALCFLS